MKPRPLDDLEMFELLQACYPDKFPDSEDETFEAALHFAYELSGYEELADLLGRVAMLTMPVRSGLTGQLSHCLGTVTIEDGAARMLAAVRRDVVMPDAPDYEKGALPEISTRIRSMADKMEEVARAMQERAMLGHAEELIGAAGIARTWADGIEGIPTISTEDAAMCGLLSEIDD